MTKRPAHHVGDVRLVRAAADRPALPATNRSAPSAAAGRTPGNGKG